MGGNGSAPIEAEQIQAAGRTVTLTDGRTVVVRFTFAAIMEIEKEWGSVGAWSYQLTGPGGQPVAGPGFTAIAKTLAIMAGEPLQEIAQFAGALDPRQVQSYHDVIDEAFAEGFPLPEKPGPKAESSPSDSTGAPSSTSPPSTTDEAQPTSGP